MSAIVETLRQVGRELIDKRLWPVAVVLLAALVAVPVLIGGSNSDAAAPAAVAAADPGAAAVPPTAEPAGQAATKSKPAKNGKIKDPFFDPPKPPDAQGAAGGGGGAGAATATATAGGSTAGSTRAEAKSPAGAAAPRPTGPAAPKKGTATSKSTTPAVKPRVTPAPRTTAPTSSYLRTVVRVNGAGGGKAHPISRLTPLGGTTDPAALFLGVAKAGARYAVFVLGPRATSRGQATCKGDTDCRMIGLKAGQTQVVTVRPATGGVRRFTLRIESIKKVKASAARARTARARVHPDGRRVHRAMRRHAASEAALRTARYDRRAGVLRAVTGDAVKNASE